VELSHIAGNGALWKEEKKNEMRLSRGGKRRGEPAPAKIERRLLSAHSKTAKEAARNISLTKEKKGERTSWRRKVFYTKEKAFPCETAR